MSSSQDKIPSKPYILRAMFEWILDNGWTPFVVVNTSLANNISVPEHLVVDHLIILDLAPDATNNYRMGNDAIEFDARFGGNIFHIFLPIPTITAIYAKETGDGISFSEETENKTSETNQIETRKKPKLTLVK